MPRRKVLVPHWLKEVEEHNYPAAVSYLSLLYPPREAKALVKSLRKARYTSFKSKDIFRASGLSLLGVSNARVESDRKKIARQKGLSPILLVRDPVHGKVIVADGYHRLCAVFSVDENAPIPCKIVDL
jgi:hypothetical protein